MPTLLAINECLNLSTGNIAQGCIDVAVKNGWTCYFAYSSREPSILSKAKLISVGSKWNAYLHYLESLIFDREGLSSRSATKKLIDKIKNIRPDIVHLHNIHDHWLNYQMLFEYLNSTNIKIIWTFHDCWAFTGHCFHFVTKGCERWKTGCYDCLLQREYPKSYIDRSKKNYRLKKELFTANKNLTIVACSEWMADLVRLSFFKDNRIEVINNGIDLDVFKPCVSKPNDGKNRVLAVSNVWNKEKGYNDILKLRELLPSKFEITIVGLTQEQLIKLPYGITGIIHTQNVQELVDLYSSSDVLINPTYADTFPTINIEALACCTPVVTYRTGGSPEIIDNKTGLVVSQGDVKNMAESIIYLKNNPLKSVDCRKRAEEKYDKNKNYKKYIELYKELISH